MQPTEGVTLAPKITVDDAKIDWTRPAVEIDRLVRGCQPNPGAWTTFRGERFKIVSAGPGAATRRRERRRSGRAAGRSPRGRRRHRRRACSSSARSRRRASGRWPRPTGPAASAARRTSGWATEWRRAASGPARTADGPAGSPSTRCAGSPARTRTPTSCCPGCSPSGGSAGRDAGLRHRAAERHLPLARHLRRDPRGRLRTGALHAAAGGRRPAAARAPTSCSACASGTHAAVSETVDLAAATVGRRVTGLVNAVLRRVAAHDRDDWVERLGADLRPARPPRARARAPALGRRRVRRPAARRRARGRAGGGQRQPGGLAGRPAGAGRRAPSSPPRPAGPSAAAGPRSPSAATGGNPGDLALVRTGRAGRAGRGLAARGLGR